MSEFSSGSFRPFGGPQILHQQKYDSLIVKTEEDDWDDPRRREDIMYMERVFSGHGSLQLTPELVQQESALMLQSSSIGFEFLQDVHQVPVDAMFSRVVGYETSHGQQIQETITQLADVYGAPNEDIAVLDQVSMSTHSEETPTIVPQMHYFSSSSGSLNSPPFVNVSKSNADFRAVSISLPNPSITAPAAHSAPGDPYCRGMIFSSYPREASPKHRLQGDRERRPGSGREFPPALTVMGDHTMSQGLSSQPTQIKTIHGLRCDQEKLAKTGSREYTKRLHIPISRVIPDHMEHVQRERQRRDDMSAKIATLETLLPSASKRDRVSIVHDGILYVKSLQQKVKALQDQLSEAKRFKRRRRALNGWSTGTVGSSSNPTNLLTMTNGTGTFFQSSHALTPYDPIAGSTNAVAEEQPTASTVTFLTPNDTARRNSICVELHVQVDRPGEKVQIVKCICRHSYLSSVMRTLEQLQLSVRRCSVTKLHDYVICILVIKPTSNCSAVHGVSSAQIATLLKIAADGSG